MIIQGRVKSAYGEEFEQFNELKFILVALVSATNAH